MASSTARSTAKPFLMFQNGQASSAISFYISTIPHSHIISLDHYVSGEAGAEGTVKMAKVSIAGLEVMIIDSAVKHDFDFTPSMSFFVDFKDEEEVEKVYNSLLEGQGDGGKGKVMMPLDGYWFSRKFAWVQDRWGVSWQLNLE
ncbi:uncharacterized protein Z518_06678 [Rhinocladiella mackenziei CBS 650.93]|uniref:Rhinocladiella mackenziei CBS 650.93 unplaced genomic scaffold supercont1.5, whole genome shotgun sequence n=1 Tax=Rhinocladiella mackenziei CBS 650.93 TaxID=1442369 RepID=A0A0D2GY38_9EURO|nr:uncharacterized protein Z518_06678 [Rhinocladiella mackenziei CBS 650.93]KIX03128.1 hypothetical protein Z518_06678 [Rhinocladiella mackenziei CBS 650.93]